MVVARPSEAYPDQSWSGWGDAEQVPVLSDAVLALIRDGLGVAGSPVAPRALSEIELAPPGLPDAIVASLTAVVGTEHVLGDPESRIRHTRGKSTPDLLRLRAGEADDAPDLVVLPDSHDQVMAVLRCARRAGSRSCRSAAGRPSSAASTPDGLRSAASSRSTCAG